MRPSRVYWNKSAFGNEKKGNARNYRFGFFPDFISFLFRMIVNVYEYRQTFHAYKAPYQNSIPSPAPTFHLRRVGTIIFTLHAIRLEINFNFSWLLALALSEFTGRRSLTEVYLTARVMSFKSSLDRKLFDLCEYELSRVWFSSCDYVHFLEIRVRS